MVLAKQSEPTACSGTDKCHAGAVNMTECVGKERPPVAPVESEQPDPDSEPEKESGNNGILAVVLIKSTSFSAVSGNPLSHGQCGKPQLCPQTGDRKSDICHPKCNDTRRR